MPSFEDQAAELKAVKYAVQYIDDKSFCTHYFNSESKEVAYYIYELECLTVLAAPRDWGDFSKHRDPKSNDRLGVFLHIANCYIVKFPFEGCCETVTIEIDGVVKPAYSNKSVDEYLNSKPDCKLISLSEYDELWLAYYKSMITEPKLITSEQFNEMLDVTPPARWSGDVGFESFHLCEKIAGNICDWYARKGDKYYTFVDESNIEKNAIREKIARFTSVKLKLSNEQIADAFKVTALWQDENLDSQGLSIKSFDDASNRIINELVSDFIALLSDTQIIALNDDDNSIGHSLCLELMGHGAGFFDSKCEVIASISELDFMTNFTIESPFVDDGIIVLDISECRASNES